MIYFSIDYRSPPSGMGQIIDTTKPEMIGDQYNYILIDYGSDPHEDPSYVLTKYFYSEQAAKEGWAGPIFPQIFQFLRDQGVTHVYDGELSYEEEGADDDGYFPLDRWIEIMNSYL
tara:strand:+ start:7271 stop:7618 length:348 start_codon:yes stop_codon:yes gene_type:complete